jgi:hypothetical protein
MFIAAVGGVFGAGVVACIAATTRGSFRTGLAATGVCTGAVMEVGPVTVKGAVLYEGCATVGVVATEGVNALLIAVCAVENLVIVGAKAA